MKQFKAVTTELGTYLEVINIFNEVISTAGV
jgi:hypothetical protein